MATLTERGLHTVVFENEKFCIPTQYQILETLGRGASGIVVSALDNTTGERVAIKKNKKVFRKDSLLPKRVLREILVLSHLHDHPNILAIKNTFLPKSYKTFRDVYIVTEVRHEKLL
jgi:serine/threonine protein kinase